MTIALAGLTTYSGFSLLSGNERFYSNFAMPAVQAFMDGEQAHNFAIFLAKYGLVPFKRNLRNEQILVNINS